MFTAMFIAVFVTVAKIWNQPKHSSVDEWIKKSVIYFIYTMEYCTTVKKNEF